MMKMIKSSVRQIDIFGQPIRLQMDGEENVKSMFGSFMTTILVLLIAITFGIYAQDCLFKRNPAVLINTEFREELLQLNQTYFRFQISTGFSSPDSTWVEKMFDLTPYFDIRTDMFRISNCKVDNSNFTTNPVYNGTIYSNNWYCYDFSNIAPETKIEDFYFVIAYCSNNPKCKEKIEINRFIANNVDKVVYSFDTQIINPQNYTNPIPMQTYLYKSDLYPNSKVLNYLGFTTHKLFTDDGFVYANNYTQDNGLGGNLISIAEDRQHVSSFINFCDDTISSEANDFYCNRFFRIYLNNYKKVITYQRTYKRISDALANVGGISGILVEVFRTIMNIYCTFIRDERIANYIYDFEIPEDAKVPNDKVNNKLKIVDKIKNIDKISNSENIINQIADPENSNNDKISNLNSDRKINPDNITQISKNDSKQIIKSPFPSIPPSKKFNNIKFKSNRSMISNEKAIKDDMTITNQLPFNRNVNFKHNLHLVSLDKLKEHKKTKKYRFKFCDVVCYHICCHRFRVSKLNYDYVNYLKVNNQMSNLLDIKRILYLIEGSDNLKMILLNNEQYALLNFMTKYNFSANSGASNNRFTKDKNYLKNEENLRKLVNRVLLKVNQDPENLKISSTTSKLIDYLDANNLEYDK